MQIKKIFRFSGVVFLFLLGACGGGGGEDDDGPPIPVTTTNYAVDFSSTHVIGAPAAPDTVSASAALSTESGEDILASGSVTVTGTDATAVTINVGYAGENGPVAVPLVDAGSGRWEIPNGTELDLAEFRRLDATGYYVLIRSADGDLRGQILPPGWGVVTLELDASSVVPDSSSTGTAKAGFAIHPAWGTYQARVTVTGIGDVVGAGIRRAIAGAVGDLVAPLEESMTTAGVWGSRDINNVDASDLLTPAGIDLLVNGELYFSIETASYANGALRGQIIDESINVFETEMTSSQVVTGGPPVVSGATGRATVTWLGSLSRLGVAVNTDIPDALGVGVYEGAPGENGSLVFSLTPNVVLAGNWLLPPTELSTQQAGALEDGRFYVSIVTLGNPNGELRGQLFPENDSSTAVQIIGESGVNRP